MKQKSNYKFQNFDINNLDSCEYLMYRDYAQSLGKKESLMKIIKNANGNESCLSDSLLELAEQTKTL